MTAFRAFWSLDVLFIVCHWLLSHIGCCDTPYPGRFYCPFRWDIRIDRPPSVSSSNSRPKLLAVSSFLSRRDSLRYPYISVSQSSCFSAGAPVVHDVSFNALLRFCYAIEWLFTSVSGVFAIVTVFVAFLGRWRKGRIVSFSVV